MQLLDAAPVFEFYFQCVFKTVFSRRSPAGAKRNWESLLGAVLVKDHDAAPACTLLNLIGCFISQSLVRTIAVVHHKVLVQAQDQLAHGGVAIQINILMLDAAPKFFHIRASPPVHADRDLLALEHPGEDLTGELHPLVAVKHLRFAVHAQSILQVIHAKRRLHAVADTPT
jgi:hypothetical protein